jgi:hypothetical protein
MWLKPENRCLVPANSFAEYAPEPNPQSKKKDVVWFALDDTAAARMLSTRPSAGVWTKDWSSAKLTAGPSTLRIDLKEDNRRWYIDSISELDRVVVELLRGLFPMKKAVRLLGVSISSRSNRVMRRKEFSVPRDPLADQSNAHSQ